MMKKIILMTLVMTFVMSFIVSTAAFTTNQISAPASYSTSSSTSVNISGMINISAFPYLAMPYNLSSGAMPNITRAIVNFTILNKSSSSGSYGFLNSFAVNVTNDTSSAVNFWNYTATLNEGRNWIKLNFTNVSRNDDGSFGGSLTSEVIVDIDTLKYKLVVGGKTGFLKLNLSIDTGQIDTDFGVRVGYGGSDESCAAATRGLIVYNSTQGFMGCTESGWKRLNTT